MCAETVKTVEETNNLQIRDKQLKANCETYKKTVYDCCVVNQQNDITIIKSIQNWAKDLEEIFMLHDQQWYVPNIAAEIISSLKTVGVPDTKLNYVHEALEVFGDKYVRGIDHSSIQSQSLLSDRSEHYYRSKAQQYFSAFKLLKTYHPTQVKRDDAQRIGELSIDVKDHIVKLTEEHKIAVCEPTADDFEGIDDKFQEKIRYPPHIPAKTQFTEELHGWADDIHDMAKSIEQDGIKDPETGLEMIQEDEWAKLTESIQLERYLIKPTLDKKWRRDWWHWMDIVEHSIEWFKHSASTKKKALDFQGYYRELTREQIGARKEPALKVAKKIYTLQPWKLYFSSVWWRKVRIPRGARFSRELSPKLSDRSIK